MFQRIMVPLDGSRLAAKALPYATEIARRFSAQVTLIRVETPTAAISRWVGIGDPATGVTTPATMEMVMQSAADQDQANMARAQRYLGRRIRELRSQGIKASKRVVMGDPARSILNMCRREDVDLVVMTTRGRSGLRRAILGSVADRIVRQADLPVLIIGPGARRKSRTLHRT